MLMVDAKMESRFGIAGLVKNGKVILAEGMGYYIQARATSKEFGGKYGTTLPYLLENKELFSQDWLPISPK